MQNKLNNLLVTGGAGFIGANFIHYLLKTNNFKGKIVNFDKLTYAGNLENLSEISDKYDNYTFIKGDITDYEQVSAALNEHNIDTIVHFAAESHVDRSITGPGEFIHTNINGTFSLLEACRKNWLSDSWKNGVVFHHVSTDEVFGSLGAEGAFTETTRYKPNSPYSASKASSDMLVRSYNKTYGLPMYITNCSNNYGPYQFPEKLIPLMILNCLEEKALPVYGKGENIRDWLYVEDHADAIWAVLNKGRYGETYNIGGQSEYTNMDIINLICNRIAAIKGKEEGYYKKLITYVKDRPGHDFRYAMNISKINSELNWKPGFSFENGIQKTIEWYLSNNEWVEHVKSGSYQQWIEKNYQQRGDSK